EFPQIRIDNFRQHADRKAPLACFLSHVHSDHLTGLESLRAPFVYCSAATREILLRLEKYHYRVNFAKGILESRNVTYDRNMRKLAKPLQLETPTVIELGPENKIRVTLFDANHCVGAVMFLIEGNGTAILYTGDIRAETWWVNSLVRNPVLIPYTIGTRRLDCVYLDTTFASKSRPYNEFPSKAEGIRELLAQVEGYPPGTTFYFHSWTFGYEDVWLALSAFLESQIHLDDYRYRLYTSLSTAKNKELRDSRLGFDIREAAALCGFRNGNHIQQGCLTSNTNVRLHSCERGMGCPIMDKDTDSNIVHIIPIISRTNGVEIAEVGAGGGKGDLDQREELDTSSVGDIDELKELCKREIDDEELLSRVLALLQDSLDARKGKLDLPGELPRESQDSDADLSLHSLVSRLEAHVEKTKEAQDQTRRTIRFPYSRHSSYSELCCLVKALNPKDIFPCTVDEKTWTPNLGMRALFGEYCSADIFRHDAEMTGSYEQRTAQAQKCANSQDETQRESQASSEPQTSPISHRTMQMPPPNERHNTNSIQDGSQRARGPQDAFTSSMHSKPVTDDAGRPMIVPSFNSIEITALRAESPQPTIAAESDDPPPTLPKPNTRPPSDLSNPTSTPDSKSKPLPTSKKRKISNKELAYKAALGIELTWQDYGGLVCTKKRDVNDGELEL
ncbi:hypothetical protein BU24DRAFT_346117, partial [Aaosphaeria arxii CBS 175.79]